MPDVSRDVTDDRDTPDRFDAPDCDALGEFLLEPLSLALVCRVVTDSVRCVFPDGWY